jgi:TolA-binding protein
MISPRLSILMVAMSVVGTVAPMAAMADSSDDTTAANLADISNRQNSFYGSFNDQENNAVQYQSVENEIGDLEGESDDGDCNECGSISRGADVQNTEQDQELDQENTVENNGDVEQSNEPEVDLDQLAIALGELDLEL